MHEAVLEEY